ncbi:MAG: PqqD family protein [Thermoleophilia bacterium]
MSDRLLVRQGRLEWRELEGEVVIVDLATSRYLGVNPSGAVLWPLLLEGTTRDDLVAALVARYGIEVERAAGDVDAFVAGLRERDLLEP